MPGRFTRPLARLAVVVLLLLQTACSQSSNDPMGDALNSLAGNWKVVSLDRSGKKSSPGTLKDMGVTVEGDKFKFEEVPPTSERAKGDVMTRDVRFEQYILQVNPAKSGDIDLIYTMGENEGKSRLGLYSLEGETLRICLASVGNPRPEQIAPARNLTVFVLQRQP